MALNASPDVFPIPGGAWRAVHAASIQVTGSSVTGALVLNTGSPPGNEMNVLQVMGYVYLEAANNYDITVSGYWVSNGTFTRRDSVSSGTKHPSNIRWARDSNGHVCLIIGDVADTWSYPKFWVDAMVGHSGGRADLDKWSMSFVTDLTGYQNITAVADRSTSAIPELPASKITSGTLAVARIPDLAIDKITNLQSALDAKADSHSHDYAPVSHGVHTTVDPDNGRTEADAPSTYPLGVTLTPILSAFSGNWPTIDQWGTVYTIRSETGPYRHLQYYYANGGEVWYRFTGAANTWGAWSKLSLDGHTHAYAPTTHDHDSAYAASVHTHSYAPIHSHPYASDTHNHDSAYAASGHTHSYAPIHSHPYASDTHNHDSAYATSGHTHAYSPTTHNHSTLYAPISHTHNYAPVHSHPYASDTHTHSYAPVSHPHNATEINYAGGGLIGGNLVGPGTVEETLDAIADHAWSHNHSASQLTSGTLPDARLSGSYTGLGGLSGSGLLSFPRLSLGSGDALNPAIVLPGLSGIYEDDAVVVKVANLSLLSFGVQDPTTFQRYNRAHAQVRLPNGSASDPALASDSYPATGLLFPAAHEVSLAAGGSIGFTVASGNGRDFHGGVLTNINEMYLDDGSAGDPSLMFDSAGTAAGFYLWSSSGQIAMRTNTIDFLFADSVLRPTSNGTVDLGASTYVWEDVWCADAQLNGSDERLKDIHGDSLGLDFIDRLKPKTGNWKGKSRPHQFLIAQDVKQVMDDLDIDFAGYVDPTKEVEGVAPPKQADFYDVMPDPRREDYATRAAYRKAKRKADDWRRREYQHAAEHYTRVKHAYLFLRYPEFIPPLIRSAQELHAKVKDQQAQIDELRGMVLALG